MPYAIMRCKKLKSMGSVASSLQHYFRERETANADPARIHENGYWVGKTTDETMGLLREQLPDKHRKDAVRAVEYMMTASPEWWEKASKQQQTEFVKRSGEWLIEKYGKDNVIAFGVHRDEKTPHVSAFVVPRTADGRLSAKEFIGNRDKMRADQTTYAEKVAVLGLERGVEGSKAKHVTIQQYYARVNEPTPAAPNVIVPKPSLIDRTKVAEYGDKVAQSVIDQLQPAFKALHSKAKVSELAKPQIEAAERARKATADKLDSLAVRFVDLRDDRKKLLEIVRGGGERLERFQKYLVEKEKSEPKQDKGLSR